MKIESNIPAAQPVQGETANLQARGGLKSRGFPRIRLFAFGLLAVFLVWEVVTQSLAAYFAEANPELALHLRSSNPTALLNLAESKLRVEQPEQAADPAEPEGLESVSDGSNPTKEMPRPDATQPGTARSTNITLPSASRIRAWTEHALINDPLNARAFSLLGQLSNQTSNDDRTKAFMKASVDRSIRQTSAVYWMMRNSYETENFHNALHYADTLLRTRPLAIQYVIPILGKIAELDKGSDALKELLATNPPWRSAFFSHLPASITDARTPLRFLIHLKDTKTPPTASDLRSYLTFLIKHKFYDLAYYTWLQFLPPAQLSSTGHLFNGSFEIPSTGLPFDWTFTETAGVRTNIAARPEVVGEHALLLEFGLGRVHFGGVRQLILLGPGRYQFRGQLKLDIVTQQGLRWDVRCVDGRLIGEGPLAKGSHEEWKKFEFSFTVPSTDCPAQYVRLYNVARSESERFISGSAWYDDLQITRAAAAEPGVSKPDDAL